MKTEATTTVDGISFNVTVFDNETHRNVTVTRGGDKRYAEITHFKVEGETHMESTGIFGLRKKEVTERVSKEYPPLQEHVTEALQEAVDTVRGERDFSERVRSAVKDAAKQVE